MAPNIDQMRVNDHANGDATRVHSRVLVEAKRIGAACTSPGVFVKALDDVRGTIGNDAIISRRLAGVQGVQFDRALNQADVDDPNRIVSAPPYIYETTIT